MADALHAEKAQALTDVEAFHTDNNVCYCAVIAPELESKYNLLQRQLDKRESKLDNTKNKQEVNSRLRRLMAHLEAEGLMNGAMSHDREPPPRHQPAKMYPLAPSPTPPHCHTNYIDATTSTPADM